ncbi:hypothetical protein [Eubacterium aggregans]|uniref:hypothetical protein n=1 Tax=Eubacterium aggregans TaxID=81409 RepID=UPI003F3649FA
MPEKVRSVDEIETEITDTKAKESEDTKRKTFIESEMKEDESYLKARLAASIGTSVGDASKALEQRMENVRNNARGAAAAKEKLAENMLRMKFEFEEKNTENLGRIASFTQKIKNANIDIIDTSVIINSLQLAANCLSTVGATLATTALFWKSIERACDNLSSDITIETLSETIEGKSGDPEGIVRYVTTNKLLGKNWFIMECQWQALYLVCDAYYNSCNHAMDLLGTSFKRAETDRRVHWQLAQEMAKALEEKLSITLRSAQSKDEDFKKRVALAQKEREKLLLDISNE